MWLATFKVGNYVLYPSGGVKCDFFHSKKKLHSLKDRFLNEVVKFGKITLDTSVGSMEWCGACWISSAMKPKRMCLASTPATKLQVCPYEGIESEIKMTSKTTKSVIFVQHRNEYWSSIGPPNFWFLSRNEVFADLNPQNLRCTLARRKSEAWQQIQRHHVFAFHSFSLTILGEASPENRM